MKARGALAPEANDIAVLENEDSKHIVILLISNMNIDMNIEMRPQ